MGTPKIRHSAAVTLSARWLMNRALRERFAIFIWRIHQKLSVMSVDLTAPDVTHEEWLKNLT